jgi:hypothetical protein
VSFYDDDKSSFLLTFLKHSEQLAILFNSDRMWPFGGNRETTPMRKWPAVNGTRQGTIGRNKNAKMERN